MRSCHCEYRVKEKAAALIIIRNGGNCQFNFCLLIVRRVYVSVYSVITKVNLQLTPPGVKLCLWLSTARMVTIIAMWAAAVMNAKRCLNNGTSLLQLRQPLSKWAFLTCGFWLWHRTTKRKLQKWNKIFLHGTKFLQPIAVQLWLESINDKICLSY